jgi:hypothetical protein
MIGSIRRECLDHVIILNPRHLRRVLRVDLAYYQRSRTHLGLNKDAPDTAMGAHYFIRDNELHFEDAASGDKDFIVVEGATHGFAPCTACENTPASSPTASGTSSTTSRSGSTPGSDSPQKTT